MFHNVNWDVSDLTITIFFGKEQKQQSRSNMFLIEICREKVKGIKMLVEFLIKVSSKNFQVYSR